MAGLIPNPKLDETDEPTKPFYGPTKPPGNTPVLSSPNIKKWDAVYRHVLQAALFGTHPFDGYRTP